MNVTRLVSSEHKRYGTLSITVRRRDGSIKYVREQQVDSLTQVIWQMIRAGMHGLNSVQGPRYSDGGAVNIPAAGYQATKGGAGTHAGILLGRGSGAVLVTNYNLTTLIPQGIGTNEMLRSANETTVGNTGYTITRVFENASGGTIDISEAAVAMSISTNQEPTQAQTLLICRDLVDPAVSVNDGESATVIYDLFFNSGNRNLNTIWALMARDLATSVHTANTTTFWRVNNTNVLLSWTGLRVDAGAGQTRNIFVGSGETAPIVDERDLEALIPHGVGSGELLYGTGETSALVITNNNERLEFDVTRVITNESGGDITIRELGLFSNTVTNNMGTRTMLDRYILPIPLTLAHGESRVARWLFRYAI